MAAASENSINADSAQNEAKGHQNSDKNTVKVHLHILITIYYSRY